MEEERDSINVPFSNQTELEYPTDDELFKIICSMFTSTKIVYQSPAEDLASLSNIDSEYREMWGPIILDAFRALIANVSKYMKDKEARES